MKLLHTADWHLGKTLMGNSLVDDQEFILNQILAVVEDEKINAVIIAGDIYDRADPSGNAVKLFDEILFKLTEKKIPVLCIAGNHDNTEYLSFGSRLFANKKFFITAKTAAEPKTIALEDEFGEIYFSLIPYFEPGIIREKFFGTDAKRMTFNEANKFYVDISRQKIPAGVRSVAVAHVFIDGGEESDSERKFVGTAGKVDPKIFSAYDYAALGHLHKHQKFSGGTVCYSGSPLKYSEKEFSHEKGVTIVEFDGKGLIRAENLLLKPRRDLISVKGTLEYFLSQPKCEDYAYVTLTNEQFVYDAAQKLRGVFPHLMAAKNQSRPKEFVSSTINRHFRNDSTLLEQFDDFFADVANRRLTDEERVAMKEICGG